MLKDSVLDSLVEEIMQRAEAKSKGLGYKAPPSGSPTSNYMHGPGGIFGVSGLERDLISTRVQPRGLASVLPAVGTIRTNPLYPYITGFLADTGTNPDGVCDDPQTSGLTKSCIQTAQFGRYSYQTKEIEINRVGQQIDRGEFLDLRLVNDPLLRDMGGLLSQNIPGSPDLIREVLQAFVETGVSFQNKLVRQLYTGNPANNSGGGGYKEFPGLDILIGTNKYDALTGTACPALDSDIKNFNYGLITDPASADIVQVMSYMYRYLSFNAEYMGMDPVTFAITMRPELFYEITQLWPCSYLTYQCVFRDSAGAERVNVSGAEQVAMRDAMRNGQYILIDGKQIPVILDQGIVEETNTTSSSVPSGQFASDIYFIPMTIRGGYQATYMEYLDYQAGAMPFGVADGRFTDFFWTDGGRFLWGKKPPTNWCLQWLAKIEPRVILRTPQLAGRILNVRYAPLQHVREPFPGDPYFKDGGVTSRPGPSYYSDWNTPA